MCLVSVKLYCSYYLMCHCLNLYHVYNNNYNNNYSFVILICMQPSCKPHVHVILLPTLFVSPTLIRSSNTQLVFTQGWLNCYWLSSALSCPFIYARLQSSERSQSRRFGFSPSLELYRDCLYMCILILVFPLMLVVIGLLVPCSTYFLVYTCVLCTHYLLLRFLSLCLRYLSRSCS